ncbi:hypothetical protein K3N28_20955 [Glycomyces sp. TRM65418]|uniref:hypothetical protein n=1 Tax=Glycomyces sp. TRM65418 TaxID=2867006 RepID=UPI001CE5F8CC|nr:hypothetical protein [Glycomyces sp. TRM65418]MCC3765535.1 hypothetical protein [Glycomyces sp. TRM65418]QZD55142.1 hypothetical protein K3N28_20850 [Glycomyces sp. TRM65418]
MAGPIPAMLRGLIDDAALFPPGSAPMEAAVPAHRGYRQSWFEALVGPLLVPQSRLGDLDPGRRELRIGVIVDGDLERVAQDVTALPPQVLVVHYESRHPLERLAEFAPSWGRPVYAELPFGDEALDAVRPTGFTPKFRTGGLSAEFFPAPETLAAAIAGCRRRGLQFKLTAGLHRAVRHRDPETGFDHHGFLNVLVAAADAEGGAGVDEIAATLASTDAEALAARARRLLARSRPLLTGFGSCSVHEPLDDLTTLGLLRRGDTR